MILLSSFSARQPIGTATINGQSVPILATAEFLRALQSVAQVVLPSLKLAQLPAASGNTGMLVFVTDAGADGSVYVAGNTTWAPL